MSKILNSEFRISPFSFLRKTPSTLSFPPSMKLLLLLLLSLSAGCEAVINPPAKMDDPVPIFFAKYNVHSTILLPQNGKYVDYSFGDWNYAALRHKFINDAMGALTISFCSTLERRIVTPDPRSGQPILYDHPDLVVRLFASRSLVDQRIAELERRFQADLAIHRADGMITYRDGTEVYVKDSEHYGLTNNCNHMTAATLRALGYHIDGATISNDFHLGPPQPN
jgi:hypothetical protein